MQTTTNNANSRTTIPEWYFLGEYPLNELMIEMDNRDKPNTSRLEQTIRDMGIHPEFLSSIESKLIRFAKEAVAHLKQGSSEPPVYIRLFYQKKMIEGGNSTKSSSQFTAKHTSESSHIIHQSDTKTIGGWGYFLIQRGGDFPIGSSVSSCNWIDLYFYKEGE
jgi:hypothetical protein